MYFSVVVTVYNVEPYLKTCVDSILAQTYRDFELILVDDGSPDGAAALCDAYAAQDSRIRVIHQPNAGVVRARQAGLRAAAGEYILFVDGDDWISPQYLIRGRELLEKLPWMCTRTIPGRFTVLFQRACITGRHWRNRFFPYF